MRCVDRKSSSCDHIKHCCWRHESLYYLYFHQFFRNVFFPFLICCYIAGWKDFLQHFFLVLRRHFTRSISLHSCLSQNVKLFSAKSLTFWRYNFPMLSNSCRTSSLEHANEWRYFLVLLWHTMMFWLVLCLSSPGSHSSNSISLCNCHLCQQLSKCFGVILGLRSADELPWIVQLTSENGLYIQEYQRLHKSRISVLVGKFILNHFKLGLSKISKFVIAKVKIENPTLNHCLIIYISCSPSFLILTRVKAFRNFWNWGQFVSYIQC